jgi:uncharacterized membrane protein YbaN (DUF454 family)
MHQTVEAPGLSRRWLRPLYFALGLLFLGLGVVGVFLPILPTTGPLLLAAFFFARSSERIHTWLVTHPRFGRLISDFQEGRGLPLRTKVTAVVAMTAAFAFSIGWVIDHIALRVLVAAIGVWALWYVLHFPTSDRVDQS